MNIKVGLKLKDPVQRVLFTNEGKKGMFSQYTGNHKWCIKAVISMLSTVIMGTLALLTGLSCIVNTLHHHHTYNHNSKIHPFDCYCCIKYNFKRKTVVFLKKLEVNL